MSHLGFCTLGIFAMNPNGLAGSVIQQINHGISTGMLFLIIGVIYERRHTREISEYGGLAHVMPKYAVVFAIAMLSSAGLPLLNGFIGEFTILQGAFEAEPRVGGSSRSRGVILGAAYLLWLYQRTMLGQVTNGKNLHLPDLSPREMAVFLPLIAWAIWIGVYPKPYFDMLEKPVAQIVERVRPGYYPGAGRLQACMPPTGCKRQAEPNEPVLHRLPTISSCSRPSCWRCSAAPSCCSISWSSPTPASASSCCCSWSLGGDLRRLRRCGSSSLPRRQRPAEIPGLSAARSPSTASLCSSTGSSWWPP